MHGVGPGMLLPARTKPNLGALLNNTEDQTFLVNFSLDQAVAPLLGVGKHAKDLGQTSSLTKSWPQSRLVSCSLLADLKSDTWMSPTIE